MAAYQITPLRVGSLAYYRGAFTSDQEAYKEKELFPILIFLLEGNGRKILVDTGGGEPGSEEMIRCGHAPCVRPPEERPDAALRGIGVAPEEIDTVILTHLHWDHCSNDHLFPQARFWVQKRELITAVCPLPRFENAYETFATGLVPPWARQRAIWTAVDGEHQLCEGIRLIPLPGHTPGLQGVLVDTASGPVLLASDAVPVYDCIRGLSQGQYAISSICADLEQFYRSFARLRQLQEAGVEIWAGHELPSAR